MSKLRNEYLNNPTKFYIALNQRFYDMSLLDIAWSTLENGQKKEIVLTEMLFETHGLNRVQAIHEHNLVDKNLRDLIDDYVQIFVEQLDEHGILKSHSKEDKTH